MDKCESSRDWRSSPKRRFFPKPINVANKKVYILSAWQVTSHNTVSHQRNFSFTGSLMAPVQEGARGSPEHWAGGRRMLDGETPDSKLLLPFSLHVIRALYIQIFKKDWMCRARGRETLHEFGRHDDYGMHVLMISFCNYIYWRASHNLKTPEINTWCRCGTLV